MPVAIVLRFDRVGRRDAVPYIVNARFACSNFIRLGGDVRKTCSGLVERYAPSSQKISGATLIFREPYIFHTFRFDSAFRIDLNSEFN